ncbi:hypothetical protein MKW92_014151 [Papaver armeniacum]|nr:hypothetical protein MKW92_014151 [Papaver armeniacum]
MCLIKYLIEIKPLGILQCLVLLELVCVSKGLSYLEKWWSKESNRTSACNKSDSLFLEGIPIHDFLVNFLRKCRNELIGGSVENEEPQAAVKAYKSMRKDGISVNYITIVSILGYWSAPNDLVKVGARIVLMGFGQDDYVKNSLLTMYGKCEASKLFVKMHHSGVEFDHFGFSGGLAASSNLSTLEEGQQLDF